MQDSRHSSTRNRSLGIDDFHWGKAEESIQIGIWPTHGSVETGKKIELRAAVRNLSSHPVELTSDFGLAVKHGEEVHEYFGGPRSSAPVFLEPGEFQEILGWRLDEESGLNVGINRCWVIYRPKSGKEIRSKVVKIEIQPSTG